MVLGLFKPCGYHHYTLLYFALSLSLPLSPYLFALHLSVSFLFLFLFFLLLLLLEQHIPLPISDSDAGWVIFALVQLFQRQNLFSFRFLAYAAHITNLDDEIHGVLFLLFFIFQVLHQEVSVLSVRLFRGDRVIEKKRKEEKEAHRRIP